MSTVEDLNVLLENGDLVEVDSWEDTSAGPEPPRLQKDQGSLHDIVGGDKSASGQPEPFSGVDSPQDAERVPQGAESSIEHNGSLQHEHEASSSSGENMQDSHMGEEIVSPMSPDPPVYPVKRLSPIPVPLDHIGLVPYRNVPISQFPILRYRTNSPDSHYFLLPRTGTIITESPASPDPAESPASPDPPPCYESDSSIYNDYHDENSP
uniref:Early nodulin-75-like n=1 Tax=Steinernema glaseri TaxID=37863 RepID=A0A1I7YBP1_9BILA